MKITTNFTPLTGERAVGVFPPLVPFGVRRWNRRLNFYTGRALTDVALQTEQEGRAGLLAVSGQGLSPGVVAGLEVGVEYRGRGREPWLHISAGRAITATGEDVALHHDISLPLNQLPLYPTPALLARLRVDKLKWEDNSLAQLRGPRLRRPTAAVLVLYPVAAERIGNFKPGDPCELDPQSDPFNDKQTVDGCVPMLYLWPGDWRALPAPGTAWRNRLAYTIFNAELKHGSDDILPWEEVGAPLALMGFNTTARPDWSPEFIDRYSVVRAGGRAKRRSLLVANSGNPFLWQARIQQFAEQIADLASTATPVAQLTAAFTALPPFGLLPKYAVPLARRRRNEQATPALNSFFPASFAIEAAPIPVEELDALVPGTASLLPLDMGAAGSVAGVTETVRLLAPVPLKVYDPDLLVIEEISQEFINEVNRLVMVRGQWLQRRFIVRAKAFALYLSITGSPLFFPAPDPEALDADEAVGNAPLPEPEADYGVTGSGTTADPIILGELRAFKEKYTGAGAPPFAKHEIEDAQSGISKLGQYVFETNPALVAPSPISSITSGLEDFIDLLQSKVKYVEDRIDLSFTRTQTDIYRIRQIVLGSAAATKLATSPALAAIAQGQTAIATRDDIEKYVASSKTQIKFDVVPPTPRLATPITGATIALTSGLQKVVDATAAAKDVSSAESSLADREARLASADTRASFGPLAAAGNFGNLINFGDKGVVGNLGNAINFDLGNKGSKVIADDPLKRAAVIDDLGKFAAPTKTPTVTPQDLAEQNSIVGKSLDFRTVTISDRLTQPPAPESKDYSVSNKHDVIDSLLNPPDSALRMYLDDISIPGFHKYDNNGNLVQTEITYSAFKENEPKPILVQRRRMVPAEDQLSFAAIREKKLLGSILQGQHDLDPTDGDEGAFFSASVRAIDHTVAILRLIEGRVKSYKTFIAACQELLDKLRASLAQANARLQVISNELAEARHDVSVARALMAEEQARLDAINQRREEILRDYVTFLAFCRVRTAATIAVTPSRPVDTGLREAPVPDCLHHAVNIPPELRRMGDFLREAPVRWLVNVHPLLDLLDDINSLSVTMKSAQVRAQVQFPIKQASFAATTGFYAASFNKVFAAQQQVAATARAQAVQFDLSAQATANWKQLRTSAADLIATADLIEAAHGRSDVARLSALELDQIIRVASCLYEGIGRVPAKMRLLWAEQLSQFDTPVNLRNLASLTRWSQRWHEERNPQLIEELDNQERLARRDMQKLVDFLYGRVDPRLAEAVGIINDLVRIAILLASHAPVNEIIAGRLPKRATVIKNGLIEVLADPVKVKIGMEVLMYNAQNLVVARGVVEDLAAGLVATRVVHTTQASITLEENTRVHFTARKLLA